MEQGMARATRYRIEAVLFRALIAGSRTLGLDIAAAIGAFVGRNIGPRIARSQRARRNLKRAFPEKDDAEIAAIIRDMWDNLGRTAVELAHLEKFHCYETGGRIEITGVEHIDRARDSQNGAIYVAGHFANWELLPLGASQRGVHVAGVYRAPNNRRIDDWILAKRRSLIAPIQIPKGASGARELVGHLRTGGHIAMLVDQKMNDGIAVPFFGRDAMTPPAAAILAIKYGCPIIPATIERLNGSRFRVTAFPPLDVLLTGDQETDVLAILTEINSLLESWIRARPAQWLWLHNRWPD